jgi:hypothetical protein
MPIPRAHRLLVAAVGLGVVAALTATTIVTTGASQAESEQHATGPTAAVPAAPQGRERAVATPAAPATTAKARPGRSQLPLGGRRIFPRYRLVAYYGTAGTGALGVLGERSPAQATRQLRRVARGYADGRRRVQITYELIATVADSVPGDDGDYSHFVDEADVRAYVRAARRHRAYLVLDLQPGRSTFLSQARRLEWALRKPWVGLALDPEWRMRRGQVPGRVIGSVTAAEVNRVSAWLSRLTRRHDLPQKVLMLHQFRADMVQDPERIRQRPGLAMVQHVDGFGTRSQKLTTYRTVERAEQFSMGFKLFYDEDVDLFEPRRVLRIRPRVDFVSYQ